MTVGQGQAPSEQISQFRSDGVTAATGLRIPFLTDAFARAFGLPDTRLVNMISEETPLREERPYVAMVGLREIQYSRPALTAPAAIGTGPIRGIFNSPPQLGVGQLIVSGGAVYAGGANVGTVPGTGLARFAGSSQQMCLVSGGVAYLWNGAAFEAIENGVLPQGAVTDVVFLGGRFVFTLSGTDTFWYSEIEDAGNELGLDFATAEAFPDPNVGMGILDDELLFFGANTVQFFAVSTDADAPFTSQQGSTYQRGCIARDTICFADNSYFWVGDDLVVYRVSNAPSRISSSSVEDSIRQCTDKAGMSAYVATFEGHELYVLTVPGVGTFAYDISRVATTAQAYGQSYSRGLWAQWKSWGEPTFRGACGVMTAGVVLVGDNATNQVWTQAVGVYSDAGGPFERTASAFIKIEEGRPRCTNIVLHCVLGVGNAVEPGMNPIVEMRYSDNLGRTFSPWRQASLGAQGEYWKRPYWQRLGQLRAPGRLVEIRCTDPVNVVYSHLELNAARPAD